VLPTPVSNTVPRFHYRFLDLLFEQPRGERPQLFGVTAKQPPLKPVLAFDFHVGHHHCYHLLMDIGYPVGRTFLLAGAESVLPVP